MLQACPVPTVGRASECGLIRSSYAPILPLTGIIPVGRSSLLAECHRVATGHINGATSHLNEATLININTSSDVGRSRQVATYGALWRMRVNCDYSAPRSLATLTGIPRLLTVVIAGVAHNRRARKQLFIWQYNMQRFEKHSHPRSYRRTSCL